MTTTTRHLFGAFALVLLALFVLAATFFALLHTEWGRERVRDSVERRVTDEIPGTLQLGAVRAIDLLGELGIATVAVESVSFREPHGAEVIVVDDATLAVDLAALLRGHLAFRRGTITGGMVLVHVRNGVSTLERTFDHPDSEGTQPGMTIDLASLRVDDLRVVIQPDPNTEVVVDDVEGFVRIRRTDDTPGIVVELERIEGTVDQPSFLGEHARLTSVDGEIRGREAKVVDLRYVAHFLGGTLTGTFAFVPNTDKTVRIVLDADGVRASIVALAANLRTELGGKVDIDMK